MAVLWVWGPALAQMVAIFVLSSIPAVPSLPGGLTGYTGHFIGYGLLGALTLRGFARAKWNGMTASAAWRALAFASLYGVTDEFHQSFVPNRDASVEDWIADVAGAITGVLITLLAARLQRRGDVRDV